MYILGSRKTRYKHGLQRYQHQTHAFCAGEHTAIQCGENPWLDGVEIDALDTLTPRKQLPLYFVHRVSRVRIHLAHHYSLAQLQVLVLGVPLRGGVCHLQALQCIQNDGYILRERTHEPLRLTA